LRLRILERDGYKCQLGLPGCKMVATEVDHIVNWRRGGSSEPENLQASCGSCNRAKGNVERDTFWRAFRIQVGPQGWA
jgi:5-methylcytosine-specific restriction endonuclease McrA